MTSRTPIHASLLRLPMTRRAISYAEQRHEGQRRSVDGAPFIAHPLEVACLLYGAGARDHVIAAGVLHDVLEKTDADAEDLRSRFGTRVATLVLAVSEDEHIRGYTKRKAALREQVAATGREALMVFAADKVSKVRELDLEYALPAERSARAAGRRDRGIAHYRHCLELLEELLGDSSLVTELRAELEHATTRRRLPAA
jgi:(p)ppGpp synthase/HD superfamily hydrolase